MPKKLELTYDEQKAYFATGSKMRHCYYEESIEMAHDMAVHADGEYPGELIDCRRPNESEEVKKYRKQIFVPKTKPYFIKILSAIDKIRKSADWAPRYENQEMFGRIPDGEDLETYCEKKFPGFGSLTNWVFAVLKKKYTVDVNAVIFNYPSEIMVDPGQFLEPFPHIFDSCHVLDYVPEDYAILENSMGCLYRDDKGTTYHGKSFFFVTTERIIRYDQTSTKEDYMEAVNWEHNQGELPVYRIGAIIVKAAGVNYLYESRLAGVLPEWDEALREYSDLQAAKVLHIFPTGWQYTQSECTRCKGKGTRKNPKWKIGCDESVCPQMIDCDNKGCSNGYIARGPYDQIIVRPVQGTEGSLNQIPLPPAGEIKKDVEIVKVQEQSVQDHIYYGLSSINFEFLANTPLNQSGTAKEVDSEAMNITVHSIAEDLVRIMDWLYWSTAKYRYSVQYPSDEDIAKMVPIVPVPERYDMLSSKHLEGQLKSAKDNNANAAIVNAIEIEYAAKAFNSNPEVRDEVELILSLDPLANITEDNKNSRLQNKGITIQAYVVSSNINAFVQRALEEEKDFATMDPVKQREIIFGYAQEQIDAQAKDNTKDLMPAGEGVEFDTPAPAAPGEQTPDPGEEEIQPNTPQE